MTTAPTAEQIRAHLGARGSSAKCPAHEDTQASLSISENSAGKVLLKCHAGCSQGAVIDALQARGIWPKSEAIGLTVAQLAAAKHLPENLLRDSGFADDEVNGRPVVRMDYRNADGKVSCVRYRGALGTNGGGPKFWFRKGDKQQLFGLWRLRPEPVILVEGETDSLALWAAGLNAVGVPGAEAWHERFASHLAHCSVIYVHVEPDGGGAKFRGNFERSSLRSRIKFFTVAPDAKDPCELRAQDAEAFRAAIGVAQTRGDDAVRSAIQSATAPSTRAQLDATGADFIEGTALVGEVRAFIKRFCAFPDEHALNAVALWVTHAHVVQHFHTTPRLALLSPEPGSGKTRVLEILDLLVPQSMFCLSASPAAIFRTLSKTPITLLVDECDTIFNRKGKDDSNEDLRALLNAGYKRGATIPRCVGPKHDVQNFAVYCATALAGLGDLPDTIMTRSLIIRMRRRAPTEHVEPFRSRVHASLGNALRERLGYWATLHGPAAGNAWPTLPQGIVDRPAEVWEPLIAVADAAGGEWPKLARDACVAMCKASQDNRVSLSVRLLSDLRILFIAAGNPEAMHTEALLTRLCDGPKYGLEDDAPWSELYGKPLGVRGLASMLKKYAVTSVKVKVDGRSLQGYRREALWDAWTRYLSPILAQAEPPEPPALMPEQRAVSSISGSGSGSTGSAISQKIPDEGRKAAISQVNDPASEIRANGSKVRQVPQVPDLREPGAATDAEVF